MPKVTFITTDNESITLEDSSRSLMEIAQENDVPGISGDCGGVCSCSTCHVYITDAWKDKVGAADETEQDTLEFSEHLKPNSRLSCQIELTDALDGLVVEVAPEE